MCKSCDEKHIKEMEAEREKFFDKVAAVIERDGFEIEAADETNEEATGHGPITYPEGHQPGMKVPKGGSSCSSCEYLGDDKKSCKNEHFIKWNGSGELPAPPDEYCSDWYEHPEKKD